MKRIVVELEDKMHKDIKKIAIDSEVSIRKILTFLLEQFLKEYKNDRNSMRKIRAS